MNCTAENPAACALDATVNICIILFTGALALIFRNLVVIEIRQLTEEVSCCWPFLGKFAGANVLPLSRKRVARWFEVERFRRRRERPFVDVSAANR